MSGQLRRVAAVAAVAVTVFAVYRYENRATPTLGDTRLRCS